MGLDLPQLVGQGAAGLSVQPPAEEARGGDGGLDLMDPALHVLLIGPLGGAGLGHRAGHGPAGPACQVHEAAFKGVPGRGGALAEQVRLVQALQDLLQLPDAVSLAEEVRCLHPQEGRQDHQRQEQEDPGLGAGGGEKEGPRRPTGEKEQDAPQAGGKKFSQRHS